tara:strand:+ start:49 stop:834 length:786 start_codon:yes stop_codon:yes gene_type:complete
MIIVALSGGKASAYCADWALKNYPKENVLLYFNDTKWEHPDLYRFLNDLNKYFNKEIFYDSDGRSPEELFYDNRALASNMMPFCSRILKAERLQKFYKDGDTLVFGIGLKEKIRANRLVGVYQKVAVKTKKNVKLKFPLVSENVTDKKVNEFIKQTKIEEPLLYKLGFTHNNCSGGCVRAGKKQWKLLYEKLPEVYKERERVEKEVRLFLNKDIHYLKDETLEHFRHRIETGQLSNYYKDNNQMDLLEEVPECIGVCETLA